MALSTTQVNAAFVALLGRAAEGNANAWAVNSADTKTLANTILSVDGKFATIRDTGKASIEQAKTNEDFVEALYQTILGRPADADGKDTWLNALASGTSREELMTKFVAAAKAEDPELSTFNTSNLTFLNEIYANLLNRPVDASGEATWLGLLNSGVSRAEVVAKIIDAINANKDSDDYAIYNAKMSVADAVTKVFAGPKAGLNEEQNAELNKQLVNIISSVTSTDVKATDESIKSQIEQVVGSYEKVSSFNFEPVTENMENYKLGAENATNAQTFRGTINLQDPTKSTISNKATLNTSKFSDTLIVDVIPSTAGTAFDYNGNAKQVKEFAKSADIKSLTINNGAAKIENLDTTGLSESVKIAGSADVSGAVKAALNYLEINNGNASATAKIDVNANLKEYKAQGVGKDALTVSGGAAITVDKINTGAGEDSLLVSGNGTVKTVDLGAGNDTLTVSGGSIANANIKLGSGDDKITITSTVGANGLAGATIDGGAGRDTLIVDGTISGSGTFTLKNIEVLEANNSAKVSYAQIKDQALTLTKSGAGTLEIKAADKETTIDLTKLSIVSGDNTALDKLTLSNVGSGTTSGVTITLNKDDNIAETITLDATVKGNNAVTITGFAADATNKTANDKLLLTGVLAGVAGAGTGSNANKLTAWASSASENTVSKIYFANATDSDLTTLTKGHSLFSGASLTANSGKAIVAVTNTNDGKDLTAFYLFTAANGAKTIDTITLIGTIDQDVNSNWKATTQDGLHLA